MEFALIGKLNSSNQSIESTIKRMGGKMVTHIHEKLAAVISNDDEIQKMGPKMTLAKKCDIQVVSEDFLTCVETIDPCRYIICRSISDWGGNVGISTFIQFFKTFFNLISKHFFSPFYVSNRTKK